MAVIITPTSMETAVSRTLKNKVFPAASLSIPTFELVFGEIWQVIWGGIPTLQITDMASSLRIKITDVLCNYYRWLEVCT